MVTLDGKKRKLQGVQTTSPASFLFFHQLGITRAEVAAPQPIQPLLNQFKGVFAEPTTFNPHFPLSQLLTPILGRQHKIQIKEYHSSNLIVDPILVKSIMFRFQLCICCFVSNQDL